MLSEVLAAPGPTHSVFDALAAGVSELSPGPRVAVLGFAAGGMIAPLRALGFEAPVSAVDLDLRGVPVFRELSSEWAGRVTVAKSDAAAWLARQKRPFDAIVEDLSVQLPGDVEKPEVSLGRLPELIARRLAPGGVAVVNVLPAADLTWPELIERLSRGHSHAAEVRLQAFSNRIVIAGEALPDARALGSRLRGALERIGSELAQGLHVRTIR